MAGPHLLPPPDPQFVLRGTQSAVNALHFCRGPQAQERPLLFSGSQSGLVHIWSLQTRRIVTTLDGHRGQSVTWLQSVPQGPQLLRSWYQRVGSQADWACALGRKSLLGSGPVCPAACRSHSVASAGVGSVHVLPGPHDPSSSVSQGRDLRLCMWDLAEGRTAVVDSVDLESVGFCKSSILAGAPPRWMLAVPGKGSDEVQILEMPSKTSVCTLKPEAGAKPGMPMCLGLLQTGSSSHPLLLGGHEDGSVALWDILERKVCSRIACHKDPVMGLDFDSQKARGISGSAGKVLAVWSLDGQRSLQVCHTHQLTNPGIAEVTIRPDRKILATAGWDHRIRVFYWRTMRPLAVLDFHSASVHCVAFAADGLLAAGSKDQRISVWSLYPPS